MPNGLPTFFFIQPPTTAAAGTTQLLPAASASPPKTPTSAGTAATTAPTPKPSAAPASSAHTQKHTAATKEAESSNEIKFREMSEKTKAEFKKAEQELNIVRADSEKNENDFIETLKKNLMHIYHINRDIAGSGSSYDEFKEDAAEVVKKAAGGVILGYVSGRFFGKQEELSAVGGTAGLLAGLWSVDKKETLRANAKKLLLIIHGVDEDIKLIELRMEKIAKALCMRFIFAIHELRNSPDGLFKFANFLATSIAKKIIGRHIAEHERTEEKIICLAIDCAIPEEHSRIYQNPAFRIKVSTKKNDEDWSIEGILCRSPILIVAEQKFYVRDGKENNKEKRYPPQIIIYKQHLPAGYITARNANLNEIILRLNTHSPHSLALTSYAQHQQALAKLSAVVTQSMPIYPPNIYTLDEFSGCLISITKEMKVLLKQYNLQKLAYESLPELTVDGKADDANLAFALIRHHYQHRQKIDLESVLTLHKQHSTEPAVKLTDTKVETPSSAPSLLAYIPFRNRLNKAEEKWHYTQPLKIACSTMGAGYICHQLTKRVFGLNRNWALFFSLVGATASNIFFSDGLYKPPLIPKPEKKPAVFSTRLTYY